MNEIKTMIEALRILSHYIQSGDGVANACVSDAANMIESLSEQLVEANESALFYKEQYEKTDRECTKLAMRESKANERVKELEQNQLPIENGKNRYGLDVSYFRNVINRELNRPLDNYKPDELSRVLARLSRAADESVMFEPEFSNKFAIEKKIEALESCIDENAMDNNEIDALIIYVDDVRADIEQLRKEQE